MNAKEAREICKRWEKLTDPLSDEPQISEARGFLSAVQHAEPVVKELEKALETVKKASAGSGHYYGPRGGCK